LADIEAESRNPEWAWPSFPAQIIHGTLKIAKMAAILGFMST
jgi:hypothetical protein